MPEPKIWVCRDAWIMRRTPHSRVVTVGGSAYVGNSGQNQTFKPGQHPDVNAFTQLYEAHVQWKYRGLEFRTLVHGGISMMPIF